MKIFTILYIFWALMMFGQVTFAQEFSASSYKVYDSVIVPSEFSTSAGFKLWSTISEVAIGTSTSLSFGINSGSLYFPFASSPAVSATAGTGSVSLSWTASTGYLGWNVSSYKIAQSAVSGGPYSYTSVGNVTSSSVTGLTGGTTYYFVIVASDAFGNPVASSTEISSTPSSPGNSGGGGGGGGGSSGGSSDQTGVIFSGRAYPMSKVSILKDGQLVLTTIAGPDSVFSAQISGISSGNYNFSLYGQDKDNIKSSP
ncbi:MAG: fibronectin type III domain-containing protein, partial [Candidatus Pacebacteria bacterium]|nr:fibronectin type III domain-containing protein [Candidatus Paceibacterota bacterium]